MAELSREENKFCILLFRMQLTNHFVPITHIERNCLFNGTWLANYSHVHCQSNVYFSFLSWSEMSVTWSWLRQTRLQNITGHQTHKFFPWHYKVSQRITYFRKYSQFFQLWHFLCTSLRSNPTLKGVQLSWGVRLSKWVLRKSHYQLHFQNGTNIKFLGQVLRFLLSPEPVPISFRNFCLRQLKPTISNSNRLFHGL